MVEARQLSKGMGHLIKFMRRTISKIPPDTNEAEAKASLLHQLQSFLEEKVLFARESIAGYVTSSIRDNDVVLVTTSD